MKLLVAGTTGQLARSLIENADRHGIDLLALGRPRLDLTDSGSITRAIMQTMPDFVINAVAYTAVDEAEKDSESVFAINRDGAAALAKKCAQHDIPIIHISTDYVFDGLKPSPYIETDQTGPSGIYGHSKLEGEIMVAGVNPHHIILRTSWLYSPFGHNFVKTMLHLAQTHNEVNVVDDQLGNPTYAPHLATGILKLVEQLHSGDLSNEPWGIYNMTGAGQTTWCGFAREIFLYSTKLGGPSAIIHPVTTPEYPTPAKRPANSRLDCSKLSGTFGTTLPDWRTGTAECITRLMKRGSR